MKINKQKTMIERSKGNQTHKTWKAMLIKCFEKSGVSYCHIFISYVIYIFSKQFEQNCTKIKIWNTTFFLYKTSN